MSEEIFITKIRITEVRHLRDFEIPLSEEKRKHLILTGRNGSGKTSLLEAITIRLSQLNDVGIIAENFGSAFWEQMKVKGCELSFSSGLIVESKDWPLKQQIDPSRHFLTLRFRARRSPEFRIPDGTRALGDTTSLSARNYEPAVGKEFLQHLVNIYTDRAILREQGKEKEADLRKAWLERFEKLLQRILDSPDAKLHYDIDSRSFKILEPGKYPYSLVEFSDGYGAVIDVISEMIMRMPQFGLSGFDAEGIVLIDEIETHLHIELQKRILPLLTDLFPRIQFIVTTHSPFVLNSVDNAVIYDLEKHLLTGDLSSYSSELIVESYFDQDKYSVMLKEQVAEFERLMEMKQRTSEQEDRLLELERYLEVTPKYLADELSAKLAEIHLKYFKPTI